MDFIGTLVFLTLVFGGLSVDTEVLVLRAVRGRDARLPCGQGKVFLDGPDSYVLWLKNDRDFLYRFPNEDIERSSVNGERVFGSSASCSASPCREPDTSLVVRRAADADSGSYRCRVHYQASPSRDYHIHLRIVDSPGTPKIYNDGVEIHKGFLGPIALGSELILACEVNDDQPDTMVYWRRNGKVVERAVAVRAGVLRAEVRTRSVTRSELDAHYQCLAQNADVTEPLCVSVVIKMYLPPMSVEIRLNNNYNFEAGQPRVVDCVVVGCVPPPSITWHLGDAILRPTVHKELHDGNYTVSSLTLVPSLRDNKHQLVCRAHNTHLPTEVFEDVVTLTVGYRPICVTTREDTIGVLEREAETVTCVVEASPEPLQFSWTFADSRTLYTSVKKVSGHNERYSSSVTWLPRDGDIGLLHCRATNAFGEQKRPCTFSVAAGGPPGAPDCVLLRSYPNSMRVQCKKGWDGGRTQTVHLELTDMDGSVLYNVSDPAGHFNLPEVDEERNLTAVVYASNNRGSGEARTIYLHTIKPSTASVTNSAPTPPWARWAEAAGGAVALCAAVVAAVFCARALRARRDHEHNPDLVPRSDGSFHREPDFTREERLVGTTNITVNQLASCQNQYTSTPVPGCRVLVDYSHSPQESSCPTSEHSYYV